MYTLRVTLLDNFSELTAVTTAWTYIVYWVAGFNLVRVTLLEVEMAFCNAR